MYRRATVRSLGWNTVAAVVLAAGRALTLGVLATPDALVVRELIRTLRIPWGAVRGVRLIRDGPKVLFGPPSVPTPKAEVRYVDWYGRERAIRVTALGAWRTATVQRNVDELKELIRVNRPSAPKAGH